MSGDASEAWQVMEKHALQNRQKLAGRRKICVPTESFVIVKAQMLIAILFIILTKSCAGLLCFYNVNIFPYA